MSTGALGARLGAIFYESSEHTPHGFRTTAATLLREMLQAYADYLDELKEQK